MAIATFRKEFINVVAHQRDDKNFPHPIIKCTQRGKDLIPVPSDLQVFGGTVKAVQIGGRLVALGPDDWVLQGSDGTLMVLSSQMFDYLYA